MNSNLFYRPGKKGEGRLGHWLKSLFRLAVILFFAGLVLGFLAFAYFAKDLPSPANISQRQITESTKIYDRTGKILLYDIHGEEKRTIIPFDEIPQQMRQATLAIEDSNFYNHFGLDFKGILRSILYNIIGKKILGQQVSIGGSTLTQQFIKNAILTSEKTYTRKIKEAIFAVEMEIKYSKDEIFGFYLNQVPYGSNAYGVEAAAQTFFNKNAKDLTLGEAALLASLTQAPSYYSPYGSHVDVLKARQEYVLDRMQKLGYISEEESEAAKQEKLKFAPAKSGIKAPHFVMYIKEYLEAKYGREAMETGGLKVTTTLDWDLQKTAEEIIHNGAVSNWKNYKARNAALVALDPKTGQILAMVGSYDYFDLDNDGNVNVALRDRQPGSSFKPFAYATAFQKGYTPDTVLFDLKTEFNPNCPSSAAQEKDEYGLDCYHPGDYDDKLRGPVTARQALAQSLNIPSVQMLYLAGIPETIKTAKALGITTLNDPERYGLSLVLGGGEVKLLDEVAAYGVFANDGVKNQTAPILKVEDKDGQTLEEYKNESDKVLEPQIARLISNILSDNNSRAPVFGQNSALYFADRPVAAKTGTTQGYRDAWTLGYTPSLAVGVWVGNNNNSPMARAGAGIAAAGPLWHDFIAQAYKIKSTDCGEEPAFCLSKGVEQFLQPDPISTNKPMLYGSYITNRTVKIDKTSGQLATSQTPPELIQEKVFQEVHCPLYYLQKDDPLGDSPSNPSDDPQFKNWEAAVLAWLGQQNQSYNQKAPSQNDQLHTKQNLPTVRFTSPKKNTAVPMSFRAEVEAVAPLGLQQIDFFLNDDFVGSVLSPPYRLDVIAPAGLANGWATLKARAYDQVLNRQEDQISVMLTR